MIPVLLIHGLFGSLSDATILSKFSGRQVFAPDLLGYGEHQHANLDGLTLERQADHVANRLRIHTAGPVHVVGHSIGGAVATFFAARHPALTASLTSIEGNFTLKDAFWSAKLAAMPLPEVQAILDSYRADPDGWLRRAGVVPTAWTLALAQQWLSNQPAATLQAQARAVVAATGAPGYLAMLRVLLDSGMALHLIAGADARAGWDVPDWVQQAATTSADIAATGHMMMLQAPERFAEAILTALDQTGASSARLSDAQMLPQP